MAKKRIITSYKNLPPEAQAIFHTRFSDDNWDNVIKIETGKTPFHAVLVDTEEMSYLVKVEIKADEDLSSLKELLEPNLNEPVKEEDSNAPDVEDVADAEE